MPKCFDLHVFMIYTMLSMLRSSLSYVFLSDPHASMSHTMCLCLDLFFPFVVWLNPHVYMVVYMSICLSYMFYALCRIFLCFVPLLLYVNVRVTCSHIWYHVYGYALLRSTCLYACSMLLCLCLCLRMFVSLLICSICFMPSSLFLCAPCHVCMPRSRLCVVMPCAIVAFLLLCFTLMCFGLVVRTRSKLCGFFHRPYSKAHIKGFGSSYLHVYLC